MVLISKGQNMSLLMTSCKSSRNLNVLSKHLWTTRYLLVRVFIPIDETTTFPIPTYIVPKDDSISSSLVSQLTKLQNVTLIQKPSLINVNELSLYIDY